MLNRLRAVPRVTSAPKWRQRGGNGFQAWKTGATRKRLPSGPVAGNMAAPSAIKVS